MKYKTLTEEMKNAASWWSQLDDLLWPEKKVRDKIKRRAYELSNAAIDLVVQFGYHIRFDFAPYFGSLHGYLNEVAEELHKYGIKFIDHYSCNHIVRPSSELEKKRYYAFQRHCVSLHMDSQFAASAGYAGYKYNDLREIDIRTGRPAYTEYYQLEPFCYNNPFFTDMHSQYVQRLLDEVAIDGLQADDMCDYSGFASCSCVYCRERFLREYGFVLPEFADKNFWGNTDQHPGRWGNYRNPVFRSWIEMRHRSVSEHFENLRKILGEDKILTTCCSTNGPNTLNGISLRMNGMAHNCDLIMLENNGFDTHTVNWKNSEPAAKLQKAYAKDGKKLLACSYSVYEAGAYLGWALSRLWGAIYWCSTLIQGLDEDPPGMKEEAQLVNGLNNWAKQNTVGDIITTPQVDDAILVFDVHSRDNGWVDESGRDHWSRLVSDKIFRMFEHNVSYRIVDITDLPEILPDVDANTPVVFDSCACISDLEFEALKIHAANGGNIWISTPFGIMDDKGNDLNNSFEAWLKDKSKLYPNIHFIDDKGFDEAISGEAEDFGFRPVIKRVNGNKDWIVRLNSSSDGMFIQLMDQALEAVADPYKYNKEWKGFREENIKVLKEINKTSKENDLVIEVDLSKTNKEFFKELLLKSPEIDHFRNVEVSFIGGNFAQLKIDLTDITLYAVVESKTK